MEDFHQELYELSYESIPYQVRAEINSRVGTLMAEFMGKPVTPQLVKYADAVLKTWADRWNRVEATYDLQIIKAEAKEMRTGLDLDISFSRYGVPLQVVRWYDSEFSRHERILQLLKKRNICQLP